MTLYVYEQEVQSIKHDANMMQLIDENRQRNAT